MPRAHARSTNTPAAQRPDDPDRPVLARGGAYCLIGVHGHDDAIAYAKSRRFSVNQAIGVLEVRDQVALEEMSPALERAAEGTVFRLLGHVFDKDLIRLGIDEELIPLVRLLTEEAHITTCHSATPGE